MKRLASLALVLPLLFCGCGGGDSTITGPPGSACLGSATVICPGESIADKVRRAPEGTAFLLKAGVHRLQQFSPKTNQRFTGEPGAVLSGARLLTDWIQEGNLWVHAGETEEGEVRLAESCEEEHPLCALPEDLFVDDSLLARVGSVAEVRPGTWYFDYAGDRVYIADPPAGRRIELGVLPWAIFSDATGVIIEHLTIEKYASPAQRGAIGSSGAGEGWVVRDNEVRWNHGMGIRVANGMQVSGNFIHHQGQLGLGGQGSGIVVEDNEIAFNNTAGFGPGRGGEAGATKFVATDDLVVRGNFSHHNHGPGLWTDIDNYGTLYEGNVVEDNDWRGIFHEIGYAAVIRNNIVRRNGFHFPALAGAFEGAGILVSNSRDVEIVGNQVLDNRNGIMAREDARGAGNRGPYDVVNLTVHGNIVQQKDSGRAAGVTNTDPGTDPYTPQANNRWFDNTYIVGPETRWRWAPNVDVPWAAWQAAGQDSSSILE